MPKTYKQNQQDSALMPFLPSDMQALYKASLNDLHLFVDWCAANGRPRLATRLEMQLGLLRAAVHCFKDVD